MNKVKNISCYNFMGRFMIGDNDVKISFVVMWYLVSCPGMVIVIILTWR